MPIVGKVYFRQARWTLPRHRVVISNSFREYLFKQQNGRCAICLKMGARCVDHNHKTFEVRSLLCRECNSLIGMAKENQWVLSRAKMYLAAYSVGKGGRYAK